MTTEKELDTVEVLKAIQKAKEVKSKLGQPEKKVGLNGRSVGEEQPKKELQCTGLWAYSEPLSPDT